MDSDNIKKILVVDDDELSRQHLSESIKIKDVMIVGEAANGQDAIQKAQQLKPDIILMDFQMPVLDGITASNQIIRDNPEIRVLLISSGLTQTVIKSALEAGVQGLMFKKSVPDQLEHGILAMHKGYKYFCPEVAQILRQDKSVRF